MITDSDKINILKHVLNKYDLSLDMPDVEHFFFDKRSVSPTMQVIDDENRVHSYSHSPYIHPVKRTVSPMQFENSSYGEFDNIMDWYLYENHESNPLVWQNIGNPTFDIRSSFESRRQLDAVEMDVNGNLFNVNDGNHRLLTLMINQFLDRTRAGNLFEKREIDKRYKMEIDVSLPFSDELCDLLKEVSKEYLPFAKNQVVSEAVRNFRFKSFSNAKDASSCVTYDCKTKKFTFNLNDETFVGDEQELINYLKHREKLTDPIAMWQAEDVYYAAWDTYIFKSKDKNKILEIFSKIKKQYRTKNDLTPTKFLTIKDADIGTYEMISAGYYIGDNKKAGKYAKIVEDILNSDYRETFLGKLQDRDFYEGSIKESISWAFENFGGFSMPDLHFKDMTLQEFKEKHYMFCQLEDDYKWIVEGTLT